VFWINGFYVGFWWLNLGVKDRQQAPSHLLFAHPRAKLYVTMKHEFKRCDASIKVIPCHFSYLWILVWLPCRLEWLKSGTVLTPSHHYPLWSILGVFITFAIENLAHTSPQMVLSSHSMVYISSPRHWCFAFLPTSNKLMWSLGRIRVKHTKSNNGPMEKNIILSDQGVHVCESWMIMIIP